MLNYEKAIKLIENIGCECCNTCKLCSRKGINVICRNCNNQELFKPFYMFCPNCGRPLTYDAKLKFKRRIEYILEHGEEVSDG